MHLAASESANDDAQAQAWMHAAAHCTADMPELALFSGKVYVPSVLMTSYHIPCECVGVCDCMSASIPV